MAEGRRCCFARGACLRLNVLKRRLTPSKCVERHRLPIFAGVNLSLSGFEDVHRRTQINKLLTRNGGVYTKDLKRPVTITHLLCTGDTETEKMHYSEKFNTRKEANIHLVWEEWFWDCLEFGGRFEEERYHVRRPRPQPRSSPPGWSH